jgi:hypothetical protein
MPDSPPSTIPAPPRLSLPRLHKSAIGFAVGVVAGGGLFVLTAIHVALKVNGLPLWQLNQYFQGYDVTWRGAFIGLAWGFAVGFVGGWLLGFVHNFAVGVWMVTVRMRHDLSRTKNFLDHI